MRVTINTQPKADEEDIFKAGTLVKLKGCDLILIVTNENPCTNNHFGGTVIAGGPYNYTSGDSDNTFLKSDFVKFIGNVLLEQEG